jgi:hypothetical protein
LHIRLTESCKPTELKVGPTFHERVFWKKPHSKLTVSNVGNRRDIGRDIRRDRRDVGNRRDIRRDIRRGVGIFVGIFVYRKDN